MKSLLPGIILILLVSSVLLISDLENRKYSGNSQPSFPIHSGKGETEKPDEMQNSVYDFSRLRNIKVRKGMKYRLALVHMLMVTDTEETEEGIRESLDSLGLQEGNDFTLDVFNADNDFGVLNTIIDEVVRRNFDLIFTCTTPPTQLLAKKISDIPVVFTMVADPVAAGVAESRDKHQENITGISNMMDIQGMISLLGELSPDTKHIGSLFSPSQINSVKTNEEMLRICQKNNIRYSAVPISSTSDVSDATMALISKGIECICQLTDGNTVSAFPLIANLAKTHRIPVVTFFHKAMAYGAAAVVTLDPFQQGIDAVFLAARILTGVNPAEIPWQYASKTTYIINPYLIEHYQWNYPETENITINNYYLNTL